MKLRSVLSVGCGLALVAAGAAFAASGLNIKVGLWDVTYTISAQGNLMPASVLAQMSPEQRARVEAAMRARAAKGPLHHTIKSCVTAKDLQRGAFRGDPESDCKNTVVSQTPTRQEIRFVCDAEGGPRTGHMIVEAPSNDRIHGNIEIATPGGNVKTELSGKWIGASCAGADKD